MGGGLRYEKNFKNFRWFYQLSLPDMLFAATQFRTQSVSLEIKEHSRLYRNENMFWLSCARVGYFRRNPRMP